MDSLHRPARSAAGPLLALLLFPTIAFSGSWEVGFSFPAPTSQTNGLTFDGRYLWHSNDRQPVIYQINPFDGEVVGQTPTTIVDQGDIEFGGGALWIISEGDHVLLKVNPASGETLDSIRILGFPPGNPGPFNSVQLEGVTFDGRNLWVDGNTNFIIRIDPVTRKQYKYEMSFEMGYLDGMTWAFDHLWIVTNNATIYEIDPCSMGIVDKFDAPAEGGHGPEGFAFDGENLWFADNGRDEIYQIILKFRIMTKRSAARAAAPVRTSACNAGELLTETVPLAPKEPGAEPALRGFFGSTPLFRARMRSGSTGPTRFTDARGRLAPIAAFAPERR